VIYLFYLNTRLFTFTFSSFLHCARLSSTVLATLATLLGIVSHCSIDVSPSFSFKTCLNGAYFRFEFCSTYHFRFEFCSTYHFRFKLSLLSFTTFYFVCAPFCFAFICCQFFINFMFAFHGYACVGVLC